MGDLTLILRSKGFWLIALLCLCFYSAVFPFLKYATSLMINKYQVDPALAGTLPAILPFGNLLMTPIFGGIYDRYGKGATIMVIGSVLLIVVHVLFAMPILNYWWFAAIIMVVLGIAFSLVPSAMWPSVPKIIPLRLLGSAYALIFWVQNIGLGGVPLLIGYILSEYCITGTVVRDGNAVAQYDYTLPMLIFAFFGVIALFLAIWLKIEDRKKGYGLEKPNM
jgi:MFS family permease